MIMPYHIAPDYATEQARTQEAFEFAVSELRLDPVPKLETNGWGNPYYNPDNHVISIPIRSHPKRKLERSVFHEAGHAWQEQKRQMRQELLTEAELQQLAGAFTEEIWGLQACYIEWTGEDGETSRYLKTAEKITIFDEMLDLLGPNKPGNRKFEAWYAMGQNENFVDIIARKPVCSAQTWLYYRNYKRKLPWEADADNTTKLLMNRYKRLDWKKTVRWLTRRMV